MVAPLLLDHLNNTDAKLVDALCSATGSHLWTNRVGYWIGDVIVHQLLDAGHTLGELLGWQPDRVVAAMKSATLLHHRA